MIDTVSCMSLTLTTPIRLPRAHIAIGMCAGALALTACQSGTDDAVAQSVTAQYYMFAGEPSENDIPDVELDDPALEDTEDHYFRYLGVHGSTEFYMARTDHEETVAQGLCFIAVDTETDEPTTACKGPDELDPMVVQVDTPVEAFLIPDGTHIDELPEGWAQVRTNVLAVTEPDVAADEAEVMLPVDSEPPQEYTLQRN